MNAEPDLPVALMKAVADASKGPRTTTANLLRAIAEMLDEGVVE